MNTSGRRAPSLVGWFGLGRIKLPRSTPGNGEAKSSDTRASMSDRTEYLINLLLAWAHGSHVEELAHPRGTLRAAVHWGLDPREVFEQARQMAMNPDVFPPYEEVAPPSA